MDPTHPTDEAIDYYLGPLVSSPQRKAQTNAYAIGLAPIRWLALSRHLSGAPCRHESSGEQPITSFRRPVRTILTGRSAILEACDVCRERSSSFPKRCQN